MSFESPVAHNLTLRHMSDALKSRFIQEASPEAHVQLPGQELPELVRLNEVGMEV